MSTTPPPYQPPAQPPFQPAPVQPMSPADERLWATLVHVGALLFGGWPALIGYLVLKDRGPFVNAHTKTALNFQITMLLASLVGCVLMLVIIGFFVVIAVGIVIIVFSIIAAIAANKGEFYTYPLTIEFIK
ncbi:DUF4870 domain-containing protein [Glaciihabitans arcticus]|uniref:DUF4870 domain-containing protein n=1 Tax=Glaciihabitans arcticus TaxID=2668039 RepID=A0A4Q9GS64_9MICO|nr:DUF4870 domain-containing protein [Glaciihabitans arcticus]TBN56964.1 DUF4870 domain-containing protein [Glaciihabitans arcticus]